MGLDWTIVDEIRLFRWVAEFKPAGINKHFHMYCIVERMNHPDKYPVVLLQKEGVKPFKMFTASEIWDKLSQYYDFEQMDVIEDRVPSEPIDNLIVKHKIQLSQQRDFELPWEEYGDLILDHAKGEEELGSVKEAPDESPESPPESEKEDTRRKRRSARLRKSTRVSQSSDGDGEGEGEGEVEREGEAEGEEEAEGKQEEQEGQHDPSPSGSEPNGLNGDTNQSNQPLAKRTRHSSSTSTTTATELSPNRKKRKTDPPQQQQDGVATSVSALPTLSAALADTIEAAAPPSAVRTSSRVSSRLRNRK
ncbi:uncharacterized protein ZBIST_2937 [Zygosaccharomyces bailii]|nr:uncharacterized protein ZBIST_2937 [Zygosaccharomyces bailii]